MRNKPVRRGSLRHFLILPVLILFVLAALTGSVPLFILGAIGALVVSPA